MWPIKKLIFPVSAILLSCGSLIQKDISDISHQNGVSNRAKFYQRDSEYYNELGLNYIKSGLNHEAIEAFKQANKIDTNNSEAYSNLGFVYILLNRYDAAIEACKKAIHIDPSNSEAHRNLGLAYFFLKRWNEAIAACKTAISINQSDSKAYSYMGAAYICLDLPQYAIKPLEYAIRLDPGSAENFGNLGVAYLSLGRSREAIKFLTQAIQIDPSHIDSHKNLSWVYASIGDIASATNEYFILKKLSPDDTYEASEDILYCSIWNDPAIIRNPEENERKAEETLLNRRKALKDEHQKGVADVLCNGNYWVALKKESKLAFINGFLDGTLEGSFYCQFSLALEKSYVDEISDFFLYIKTVEDMVNALDKIYHNTEMRNENIPPLLSEINILIKLKDSVYIDGRLSNTSKNRSDILDENDLEALAKLIKGKGMRNEFKDKQIHEKKKAEDLQRETGYDKLSKSDGHYWVSLDRDCKFAYIVGLMDGLFGGHYKCEDNVNTYRELSLKSFFHIKKLNDMVAALNIYYSDKIKRQYSMWFLLALENQVAAGVLSPDNVGQILRDSR